MRKIICGTAAVATVSALALGGSTRPAAATSLPALQQRAQAVADRVTGLEHHLASLERTRRRLDAAITATSQRLAGDRLAAGRAATAYVAARRVLIERAIESYKSSPQGSLSLLLSARSIQDATAVEEAAAAAARSNEAALDELLAAKRRAARLSAATENRKAVLLTRRARVARIHASIRSTLDARKTTLEDLGAKITRLKRAARREARQARMAAAAAAVVAPGAASPPGKDVFGRLATDGPSNGIPGSYLATGVSFEGLASWYGPGFEGHTTADGDVFNSNLYTAASKSLPLPTWLYVSRGGRGVVVLVNDRGPYAGDRVLDLSRAAAQALIIGGVGWVRAEILVTRAP